MKRLFAAIPIFPDQHFISVFKDLQQQLFREKIRWVSPENMHITLKFFGETPIEKMEGIDGVLKKVAGNHNGFTLRLIKTGIFGSRYKPRVIWFGIEKNEQLDQLYKELVYELNKTGFPTDRQNFVPHLSLGRMNTLKNKASFQEAIGVIRNVFVQEINVHGFTLFESRLQSSGVTYKVIKAYKLNKNLRIL